jgi:hypothetical protein
MDTLSTAPWRKSKYSGTNGGDCVEVAEKAGRILVRDTTDRGGAVLSIAPKAWHQFINKLR